MRTLQIHRCAENRGAAAALPPFPRAARAGSPEPFPVRGGQRFPAGGSAPGAPSRAIHHPAESPLTSSPSRARRSQRRENRDRDREKRGGSWGGSAPGHRTGLSSSRGCPAAPGWDLCVDLSLRRSRASSAFRGVWGRCWGRIWRENCSGRGEEQGEHTWGGQSSCAAVPQPGGQQVGTARGHHPGTPRGSGLAGRRVPSVPQNGPQGHCVGGGIEGGPHGRWWL